MKIGQGVDVHAFGDGSFVVLGGVTIPFDRGIVAHSDGDVVLHALCDALLGAAGLGDIGRYFPPDNPAWLNIDSRILLRKVNDMLREEGLSLTNADITVVAQAPQLSAHIAEMREYISADLDVTAAQVNIKATTTEHLGFTGRGEGIAAFAVVLLKD
ncbi:MAG: 2-C-methyl-D-erythritol 2,4-cyclodiphosphate synthase [Gammaproteobacteria bacterium]|nr:2-C-methyl-D-erythritol 2,4-cyclodiphosphate synthase [Gammaproteobacteria bacterium]